MCVEENATIETITGDLEVGENITIKGNFNGEIDCSEDLVIHGNCECTTISVGGDTYYGRVKNV